MYRLITRMALGLALPFSLWAQLPAIYPHAIVNAASFYSPGLPGGSIARGSIFTIFGAALGPAAGNSSVGSSRSETPSLE